MSISLDADDSGLVAGDLRGAGFSGCGLTLGLLEQDFAFMGAERKEHLLNTSSILVFSVEPADWHVQDFSHLAHELEVRRVLATLVLIHAGTCRHGINAGELAKLFLR